MTTAAEVPIMADHRSKQDSRRNRRPMDPVSPVAPVERGERPWQQRPTTPIEQHEARRAYLRNRSRSIGVESLVVVDLVDYVARLEEAKRTQGGKGEGDGGISASDRLTNIELAVKGLIAQRWDDESGVN